MVKINGIPIIKDQNTASGLYIYKSFETYGNPIDLMLNAAQDLGFKVVEVDNDANCFTRAEMLLGQGKKFKNFLGIILGTGMGGGLVMDGKLLRGKDNMGGEFGHLVEGGQFLEKSYQKARDVNNYKAMSLVLGRAFAGLVNIFAPLGFLAI